MVLHIFCDESGADGKNRHLVHGALLVRHPALASLTDSIKSILDDAGVPDEVKWSSTSKRTLPRNLAIIDEFFRVHTDGAAKSCPRYQALVVDQHRVDARGYHNGDKDVCFYKFLYALLVKRICEMGRDDEVVHITLDNRTTAGYDLDNLRQVLNNGIRKARPERPPRVLTVTYAQSHKNACLQLVDYLTGALCFHQNGHHLKETASTAKCRGAEYLAEKLGLPDLTQSQRWDNRFGIWNLELGPIKRRTHRAA